MQPECVSFIDQSGNRVSRTAKLSFLKNEPNQNLITVSYLDRPKSQVLASLFHELEHLIARINNENLDDETKEEERNYEQMSIDATLAEWLFIVLTAHHSGTLEELNATEEKITN